MCEPPQALQFHGPATQAQVAVLERLFGVCVEFLEKNPESLEVVDFLKELEGGEEYDGSSIGTAHTLSMERASPTLPPPGVAASIEAADLVQGFTRQALLDPELVRVPEADVERNWKRPRIRVADDDLRPLMQLFHSLGIVVVNDEEPWTLEDGTDVTGGLFGVEKPHSDKVLCRDGEERSPLRVIMNFIPPNCYQVPLSGDIGTLPTGYQWSALSLLAHEVFVMSTRDRKCFFYVFKLPRPWRRAMTFSQRFPRSWFEPGRQGFTWVSSGVVPMGWVSAVSVCQECHRTMLRAAARLPPTIDDDTTTTPDGSTTANETGLQWRYELRRDRAYPINGDDAQTHTWEVYVDNLFEGEIFLLSELPLVEGSVSSDVVEADRLYDEWNCAGNESEATTRVPRATTLGVRNDGIAGRREAPPTYLLRLIRVTLWLLSEPRLRRRQLQVVLGRWVRVLMLRRAGMAFLQVAWKVAASTPFRGSLPPKARDELLMLCLGAPLWFATWRAQVSEEVTISDASPEGAGVCYSVRLSKLGLREAERVRHESSAPSGETLGLWSLFDGIGGLRRSFDWLRVPVAGSAAVECDRQAKRVTQACWPDSLHFDDILELGRREMVAFHARYPRVTHVVAGMGAPCQDLSASKVGRRGLEGPQSKLFFVGMKVMERLQELFPFVDLRYFIEQVASAPTSDVKAMSRVIGSRPTELDGALLSWNDRRRLYWYDWSDVWPEDAVVRFTRDRRVVSWEPVRPACSTWLQQGSRWPGESTGRTVLTFLRWEPQRKARSRPHGLERCQPHELQRWKECHFAASPYQFVDANCVLGHDNRLRMLTAREREALMGFPRDHTLPALKSGEAKADPTRELGVRLSLVGNSWAVPSTAFLLSRLLAEWGFLTRCPSVKEVVERDTAHLVATTGGVRYVSPAAPRARGFTAGQKLVVKIMSGADHRGSDVRTHTGQLQRPNVHPRQEVSPRLWHWRTCLSFRWRHSGGHINYYEVRAAMLALQRRLTKVSRHGSKFLHLLDSAVTIAVLTRRRSTSRRLNPTCRRVAALELATGVIPVYAFVRSAHNVADRPSRVFRRGKGRAAPHRRRHAATTRGPDHA